MAAPRPGLRRSGFDHNRALVSGATFGIKWLDESTFQVVVEILGEQVDVREVRSALPVYISDAEDNGLYRHRDVAIWIADL